MLTGADYAGHYPTTRRRIVAFFFRKRCMAGSEQQFITKTILQDVLESIGEIGYGTIIFKVQNAAIAEMEITEKFRFKNTDIMEKGGGI